MITLILWIIICSIWPNFIDWLLIDPYISITCLLLISLNIEIYFNSSLTIKDMYELRYNWLPVLLLSSWANAAYKYEEFKNIFYILAIIMIIFYAVIYRNNIDIVAECKRIKLFKKG